jgi:hypothetical protein
LCDIYGQKTEVSGYILVPERRLLLLSPLAAAVFPIFRYCQGDQMCL